MTLHINPVTGPAHPEHVAATAAGLSGYYTNTDLYNRYLSICEENGTPPGTRDSFGRHMARLGHTSYRSGGTRGYLIQQPYPDAP